MGIGVGAVLAFSAAHSFGGKPPHGHNYRADVVAEQLHKGEEIDAGSFRDSVQALSKILDKVYLNDVLSGSPDLVTAAKFIYDHLEGDYTIRLVRLWETEKVFVELDA